MSKWKQKGHEFKTVLGYLVRLSSKEEEDKWRRERGGGKEGVKEKGRRMFVCLVGLAF